MRDYASLYSLLLADLGLASTSIPPITSDMGEREVASVSLASSFLKKLAPGGNTKSADANALKKFKAINESISDDCFQFEATNEVESYFYDSFKYHFQRCLEPHESFGSFDLEFIREHMGVGPGAAQKADSTYMVSKLFESPISYTNSSLIPVYRAALSETGFWADAEMQRFQEHGFVKVRGGKLFFAPKNAEISRTCCTEASLNMLVQKSIGAFFEKRLRWYFGIDLSTQPDFNRNLARIGSIDGSLGTIDLVSASDSIGLQLMLTVLQNNFLKGMLLASRSETAVLPDGSEVVLRMISTMGNGFTFPLQTVIFASVVRAVYEIMGFPCSCPRTQFGVFGDDIIVRREAYDFVIRMLSKLGFQANVGKSFNTGSFRESCGHDYYRGYNVRGVYIKSLETPQEVYSAINRLSRWSAFHGITLTRTIKLLLSWVRDIRIPPSEADDAGLHVPWKLSRSTCVDNRYWFRYRCYRKRIRKFKVPDISIEGSSCNYLGVAVGYLSGHIRRRESSFTESELNKVTANIKAEKSAFDGFSYSVSVSIRDRVGAKARYKISNESIPYWDYLPSSKQVGGPEREYDEWSVPLTRDSLDSWERVMVALVPDGGQV